MLILLSPSKGINAERKTTVCDHSIYTTPFFLKNAQFLASHMAGYSQGEIMKILKVKEGIANTSISGYKSIKNKKTKEPLSFAIHTFGGVVYQGLDNSSLSQDDIAFISDQLRIFSAMYGYLRPTDLILPYRLDLNDKIKLENSNLYAYWREMITQKVIEEIKHFEHDHILNLASDEYFKVLNKKLIKIPIVDVKFLSRKKDNTLKVLSYHSKLARGKMLRYIIDGRILNLEELKSFDIDNYLYSPTESTEYNYVFIRDEN